VNLRIPGIFQLPAANFGNIRGKIMQRFWLLGICLLEGILASFLAGSQQDFCHQDFCFLVRILGRFAAGLLRDKNLGENHGRILEIFWLPEIRLPGENLEEIHPLGIKIPAAKILPELIPPGFLPRSGWDATKIMVLILQG